MRICLVFDCLYPHTVGGAERWYRNLAEDRGAPRAHRHVPDAAPVGSGHGCGSVERGRGRGRREGRALRARTAQHRRTAAVRVRRLARISCATAAVMTSCRRPRSTSRCSRCWRRGRFAASRSSSTGSRSGRASTGSTTWAASPAASAGGASGSRRARSTTRSASRGGTRVGSKQMGYRGEITLARGAAAARDGRLRAGARRVDGRLRRASDSGEAGDCDRAGRRARTGSASPSCGR